MTNSYKSKKLPCTMNIKQDNDDCEKILIAKFLLSLFFISLFWLIKNVYIIFQI